jgi:hypothetical protein
MNENEYDNETTADAMRTVNRHMAIILSALDDMGADRAVIMSVKIGMQWMRRELYADLSR